SSATSGSSFGSSARLLAAFALLAQGSPPTRESADRSRRRRQPLQLLARRLVVVLLELPHVLARSLVPRHRAIAGVLLTHFAATAQDRGRDGDCSPPPAQTRTGPIRASGSYLECLTAKRTCGQGWKFLGCGSQSAARRCVRSHVNRSFWLRRRSVRYQNRIT